MAKQTFTSGQVLTAAQVNALQGNDFNQTVTTKTASYTPTTNTDIGTRVIMNSASATTITINTSIYSAGDTFFISNIGVGVCTLTAGTCAITSAGPLAIPQYGGGTLYFTSASAAIYYPSAGPAASSGLTFISSTTTTAATQQINNCFSATYDAYKVIISLPSCNTQALWVQFCTSGTANSNASYTYTFHGYNGTSFYGQNVDNTNTYGSLFQNFTNSGLYVADIVNPFKSTTRTFLVGNGMATMQYALAGGVCFNANTSFDGIKFSNANNDSFTYTTTIYGYALS